MPSIPMLIMQAHSQWCKWPCHLSFKFDRVVPAKNYCRTMWRGFGKRSCPNHFLQFLLLHLLQLVSGFVSTKSVTTDPTAGQSLNSNL